jgi:hypothetical protein
LLLASVCALFLQVLVVALTAIDAVALAAGSATVHKLCVLRRVFVTVLAVGFIRLMVTAVAHHVGRVGCASVPPKVVQMIIRGVAVPVARFQPWWAWADESFQYQQVDRSALSPRAVAQDDERNLALTSSSRTENT